MPPPVFATPALAEANLSAHTPTEDEEGDLDEHVCLADSSHQKVANHVVL